jgi:hypothetical protein
MKMAQISTTRFINIKSVDSVTSQLFLKKGNELIHPGIRPGLVTLLQQCKSLF